MKLEFELHTSPDSFKAEDAILNTLNDDGLRCDVENALSFAITSIMWWNEIRVVCKLKKWDVK